LSPGRGGGGGGRKALYFWIYLAQRVHGKEKVTLCIIASVGAICNYCNKVTLVADVWHVECKYDR
jgi:hypothetical protein